MALQSQKILSLYERVLYFLVLLTIATSGLSALENVGVFGLADSVWRSGWLQNFSTEMFGAALTLVLIGRIIGAEDRRRELEENEKQLDALREAVTQAVTKEMERIQQTNAIARLQAAKDDPPEIRQPIIDEMYGLNLLAEANLSHLDLSGIVLVGAALNRVNLNGTDLSQANLSQIDLSEATLRGAKLSGADVSRANLHEADLRGANLNGANLSGADLSGTSLLRAYLFDADLGNANLREANLSKTKMRGASLKGTNLREADLSDADMIGDDMRGADLTRSNLCGTDLRRTDLRGANLHDADLRDAKLSEAVFSKTTTCPDDSKYDTKQGSEQLNRFTNPDHPTFWRSPNPPVNQSNAETHEEA